MPTTAALTTTAPPVIQTPPAPPKPARLEDQIRAACRVRHYSLATEKIYVGWYKRFVRWAGLRHPATLGGDMVERWLSHLATDREVSASTQRQALAAMLFLYRQVLGLQLPWLDNITRAKQPQRLPCVLTQAELQRLLRALPGGAGGGGFLDSIKHRLSLVLALSPKQSEKLDEIWERVTAKG